MLKKIILPSLFLFSLALAGTAIAQSWVYFKSKTALFNVRVYNNIKEEINKFRISEKTVAQYGQSVSTFDQRQYKGGVVKNYIIKYEQTLGLPFGQQDAANLIKKEMDLYTDYYTTLNGTLVDKTDLMTEDGFPAGEIWVDYMDPAIGEQSIKIKVIFTESTKFQHIISGPRKWITSHKTKEHVESLDLKAGYMQDRGSIQEEWRSVTSPMRLFTVFLPEPGSAYFPYDYKVYFDRHTERVSAVFRDPIWNMKVYYNVYGYIPNGEVNTARAQSIVTQRHIKRHRLTADGLKFTHLTVADKNIMETSYDILAPKGKPNVRWVKLRVQHEDNKMVVHELLGPKHIIDGPFFEYLLNNGKFHPDLQLTYDEAKKIKMRTDKKAAVFNPDLEDLDDEEENTEDSEEENEEETSDDGDGDTMSEGAYEDEWEDDEPQSDKKADSTEN